MDTKFCTSCQCYRDTQGGVMRKVKTTARWICQPCIAKKSESVYKNRSGRVADVPALMAKLYARATP